MLEDQAFITNKIWAFHDVDCLDFHVSHLIVWMLVELFMCKAFQVAHDIDLFIFLILIKIVY